MVIGGGGGEVAESIRADKQCFAPYHEIGGTQGIICMDIFGINARRGI